MKTKILELIDKKIDERFEINSKQKTHYEFAFEVSVLKELRQEIEAIQEQPQWIPLTERLPETNIRVLVFSREGTFNVMRLDKYHSWSMQGCGYEFEYITQWMPLPPNPSSHD